MNAEKLVIHDKRYSRVEDSPNWKDPRSIRIDGKLHADKSWTLVSVDHVGKVAATGKNIGEALKRFLDALVELYPYYGGTHRDVLIRYPDDTPPAELPA